MKFSSHHTFLLDAIRAVRAGKLIPASFQRSYVWGAQDVEAFWGSIIDGFPIGSMVNWLPYGAYDLGKIARGRLGPIEADSKDATGVILDGQNRLGTIAWSMWMPGQPVPDNLSPQEEATWTFGRRLAADAATGRISFVPEAEVESGLRIPVGVLCRPESFMRYIRSQHDRINNEPAYAWFDHCVDRIRESRITVTNIENATPEEAKRAFLKICRVGVPMAEEDFDTALAWESEEPTAPGLR